MAQHLTGGFGTKITIGPEMRHPSHVNCRCILLPIVLQEPDLPKFEEMGRRVAEQVEEMIIGVPTSMTYGQREPVQESSDDPVYVPSKEMPSD